MLCFEYGGAREGTVGREANCRAVIGGQVVAVRAQLESDEVILRGEHRARLPFAGLDSVEATSGQLVLQRAGERIVLELGAAAETWAARIRNPRTLLDKLGVKPGQRVAAVGLTDAALLEQLRATVALAELPPPDGRAGPPVGRAGPAGRTDTAGRPGPGADLDLVFVEVAAAPDLRVLEALRGAIAPTGAVWVLHPKGRADLKDVHVLAAGRAAGLVDNKVARVSDTLSALRFVIPKAARLSPR